MPGLGTPRDTCFCRIWILNFLALVKTIYEATKGGELEPLLWEQVQQKAFEGIKQPLTKLPHVGFLDVTKLFFLYIHKCAGTALGVLTQVLGPWPWLVAYLFKQFQLRAGYPVCEHL